MISHTRFLQSSISQLLEYNKLEVFLEGSMHSIVSDRTSNPLNRKININPIYRVLMFRPCTVHVSRSTWYREVNMFRIFMIFVSWINGQEEYCLSSTQILTSRYHC